MSGLTFNVVLVPGTVPYLLVAVQSLLDHSPFRYRLVANGLSREETEVVDRFCASDTRLDLLVYPNRSVLEHGVLLSLLFHREESDLFAFCDSDIFAVGQFGGWVTEQMAELDVLTSCRPLFTAGMGVVPGFGGRCTHTPTGQPLMTSYFGVYRREPTARAAKWLGCGFERIQGWMTTPEQQALLARAGWNGETCDTGKLLTLGMAADGARLRHDENSDLVHVGGISWWLCKAGGASSVQEVVTLRDHDLSSPTAALADRHRDPLVALQKQRKRAWAQWFAAALYALFGDAPPPVMELHGEVMRELTDQVHRSILQAHRAGPWSGQPSAGTVEVSR